MQIRVYELMLMDALVLKMLHHVSLMVNLQIHTDPAIVIT